MNKTNIIILALLATASIYWFMKNPSTRQLQEDMLIVGTNAEFKPFTFIDETNHIVGFDIDIAKEVAARLGKKLHIKDMSFDMLIPEITQGSIHIIAAGMTPIPERAERVLFTKPYFSDSLIILSLSKYPKITRFEDIYGKEVIVNEGYTPDNYLTKLKAPINIKRLPSPTEAMLDLRTSKSYAYVTSFNSVKPYFDKFGTDEFQTFPIEGTQESTAMAVSKKYPELFEKIQIILDAMKTDGTMQKLKTKWGLND